MHDYKIVNGIVASPGKFEGEPEWIITLHEMVLNGDADRSVHDQSGFVVDAFKLDTQMAELTGYDAKEGTYVALWTNDQGFVSHMVMTDAELDNCEPDEFDALYEDDEEDTYFPYDDFEEFGGESGLDY